MARRFTIPHNQPSFGLLLENELNVYAGHGFPITQPLNDTVFNEYTDDPAEAVSVSLPMWFAPDDGRWAMLDAYAYSSVDVSRKASGPYFTVEAMLRVGDSARVLGSYSQRAHRIGAGVPFALSTDAVRVPARAGLELRVRQYGYPPTSLNSLMVRWRVANVGE